MIKFPDDSCEFLSLDPIPTDVQVSKESRPHEESVEIIRRGSGKLFDPDVVSVFLDLQQDFRAIAEEYADD